MAETSFSVQAVDPTFPRANIAVSQPLLQPFRPVFKFTGMVESQIPRLDFYILLCRLRFGHYLVIAVLSVVFLDFPFHFFESRIRLSILASFITDSIYHFIPPRKFRVG